MMFLEIAGARLEVLTNAAPSIGTPLVFLHEGLGSARLWRDLPQRLSRSTKLPAVAYSRYGNGFSSVLSGARDVAYMHDEGIDVLPAVLDRLDIERAVLFGHSDGASIALIFAAHYPERVAALVLEAPHVFVEALTIASIAAIGDAYRDGLRERMMRHHADVDRTFYGWNDVWLSEPFRRWSILELLPSVVAPALVIQGRDDEYGTVAQVEAVAQGARGPVDCVILDDCGHAPHRDRSATVEASVASWLEEALARPPRAR